MKALASRRFQPGEGPSRGLLRDCENRWIVCSSTNCRHFSRGQSRHCHTAGNLWKYQLVKEEFIFISSIKWNDRYFGGNTNKYFLKQWRCNFHSVGRYLLIYSITRHNRSNILKSRVCLTIFTVYFVLKMNICRDFLLVATILFYIYQGRKREREIRRDIFIILPCVCLCLHLYQFIW